MKNPYYFIVASAIFTMKNGQVRESWKSMTLILLSIAFAFYLISFWLILDYNFKGFTQFLTIPAISASKNYVAFYLLIYFLLPSLLFNYVMIFLRKKHQVVEDEFPKSQNKKYFMIFFIASLVVSYLSLIMVV